MFTFRFWLPRKKDPNRVDIKAASKVFAKAVVCPKGGYHQWGNPWIGSDGPEGGELGQSGKTCLKCGTDIFI